MEGLPPVQGTCAHRCDCWRCQLATQRLRLPFWTPVMQKVKETEEIAEKARAGSEERRAMFAQWNAQGSGGGSLPGPPPA